MFEHLIEGFDYDIWANRKWLANLESKDLGDPDKQLFQHLLSAQEIWLERCRGSSPAAMPEFKVTEAKMIELNRDWLDYLQGLKADPVIAYRNTREQEYRQRASRIARHVIDHGTYHRGELRGLCLSRDDWDFPETGLIGYYFELGPGDIETMRS